MDLGSLPDWSEFLSIVKKEPLIGLDDGIVSFHHSSLLPNSNLVLQDAKNMDLNDRETSFMLTLRTCESLLTLLSTIPKVQLDAKSFSVYAAYSLNLERLAVSCLLKNGTNSSLCEPYELVRLFISCRRVMKSLVSSSLDDNCGPTDSASISSVFGSSDSILWLLESVSEIVGLPHALFGVTYSSWLQDVIFPLIDHTSYIFLAISEKQMSAIKDFKINEKKLFREHSVDIMAEILKDQVRNLFTSMGSLQEIKPEDRVRVLGCSRLAVIISCFQGFLWGLVSAIDSINQDVPTVNPQYSRLIPACLPILCECITLFEEILNLCLNLLTSSQAMVVICSTGYHDNNGNSPSECAFSESPFCKEKDVLPLDTAGKANLVNQVQETNLSKLKNLKGPLLESLLKGEDPQIAYTLGKLFTASAAILKLKGMLRFPRSLGSKVSYSKVAVNPILVLETSVLILKEMAEMVGRMEPVSFVCLDGILTFLEAVGSSNGDLNLSEDFYSQIIDTHLRAIGKCISLQGKSATLYSHESGSSSKMLQSHNELNRNDLQLLDQIKLRLNAFKVRLSISFKKFILPKKFDLMIALQLLERALVGAQPDCNTVHDLTTGNLDGGEVSSTVAAGLNCLELVLESLSGHELVVGKTFSFINAVFNIILHLQNPTIFYVDKQLNYKADIKPDAGSVILMCVQILASIAGNKSIHLEAWHVSQCLHIPLALFTGFQQLKYSFPSSDATTFFDNRKIESSRDTCCDIVDRKFSVELYASCCRLLCTTLNHHQHHTEQCVAILEESVSTLLNCLEMVDTDLIRGNATFLGNGEAIKCASYLQENYEEIRNEKDVFAEHSSYFLSNYISMYSGCGPLKGGIKREVDEALRPGVYSLIDVCRKSDFKRLHTSFGEGPCRSTLKTLLHDFNVNFKYKGKI
ncbi:uncharacterized protein A4U43_C04F31180 [Asparagus officinalis]|uniref:Nucleolar 27S pre-rRNA processing Urb2/Npa2 C-terminal domain-containing protein n=2 Tax=Asparagus officinalis TaxID=4686 RepID=A0A5P1F7M7_ASPOF|nr:uncharacterized protein A4U43_C04F31180 [Asparagus officinalis]